MQKILFGLSVIGVAISIAGANVKADDSRKIVQLESVLGKGYGCNTMQNCAPAQNCHPKPGDPTVSLTVVPYGHYVCGPDDGSESNCNNIAKGKCYETFYWSSTPAGCTNLLSTSYNGDFYYCGN